MKEKLKSMTHISLCAVFITIGSWITIPFAIPFTMQTFAIFLVLHSFGGKIGGLSVLLHTAMGLLGLPVFSGFKSGISTLLGPTGGYIIGFALMGALYFVLYSIFERKHILCVILPYACLLGCYGLGTAWYMQYVSAEAPISLGSALAVCVLPYVIPDIVKIVLALFTAEKLKERI